MGTASETIGKAIGTAIQRQEEDSNRNTPRGAYRTMLIMGEDSSFEIQDVITWQRKLTPSTAFILDNPTHSLLDSSTCLLDGTYTDNGIVNATSPNNNFKEYFETTTLVNSATATYDSTNNKYTFAGAENVISKSIYVGSNNIISVLLDATYTENSSMNFYVQTESNGYEEITPGSIHTMTSQGSTLNWKVTGNNTDELSFIDIKYYF